MEKKRLSDEEKEQPEVKRIKQEPYVVLVFRSWDGYVHDNEFHYVPLYEFLSQMQPFLPDDSHPNMKWWRDILSWMNNDTTGNGSTYESVFSDNTPVISWETLHKMWSKLVELLFNGQEWKKYNKAPDHPILISFNALLTLPRD